MIKNITVSENLSYKKKVGYNNEILFQERLKKANAIDLRDNHIIKDFDNGYFAIYPINTDKKFNDNFE